jgi:hypothetical protein
LWIQPNETAASPLAGIVGGTLVVLAIIGIWAFAVWSGRGDEQFRKRAFASRYTLPEDVSLDEVISDDEVGLGFQQLEAEK